ncbi:MAG TPA: ketoacyl-ACP synthase III family protein [Pseudonocardiaceae bacterium]
MTTLDAVSAYLPPTVVPIEAICGPDGLPETQAKVFRRFYGLDTVRWDPEAGLAEILLQAVRKLAALRGREHLVRHVIAARTLQAVAPEPINVVRQVCEQAGLSHANAFALTQHACASGLLAVDLAGRLLAAEGDDDGLVLVLTGEKVFTPTAQFIPATTVMGEGTAAVLVARNGNADRVLSYATRTHGRYSNGLFVSHELSAQFQQDYPVSLAEVIHAALREAGLSLADLDLVLPHNVNRVSWSQLCQLLDYPLDRVFMDNIPVTGHCFCADPFINLQSAVERGRLSPGDRYLMVAVGLGATFSAMVLEH